ncbi:MAG: gamma-glutamylcyclotransferase [Nitrospirales bacterium]|nr:gamma-glutamylcyclotransferase [Nitrospirales bacterium]
MTPKFSYFAYGSNMSSRRLRERAPSAQPIGVGSVREHQLRWHKKSRDGSGKCDVFFTGDPDHQVHGVLFEISESEKARLDTVEGLHHGYEEKTVAVLTSSGLVFAVTYYATIIDEQCRPYEWYKRYVVEGATEYGLPESYVQWLKSMNAIKDPDRDRHQRAIRILEGG